MESISSSFLLLFLGLEEELYFSELFDRSELLLFLGLEEELYFSELFDRSELLLPLVNLVQP
jgi:hypothetical protein